MASNSVGGQRPRLPQHIVADADLADVVQQRAEAQDVELGLGQVHLVADRDRDGADALGMASGVRIPRVERQRERANRADVRAARVLLRGRDRRHHGVERLRERVDLEARAGRGIGVPKSRDCVIAVSDRESVSIGRATVWASQRLADGRRAPARRAR